jgi:hypothetical protein
VSFSRYRVRLFLYALRIFDHVTILYKYKKKSSTRIRELQPLSGAVVFCTRYEASTT